MIVITFELNRSSGRAIACGVIELVVARTPSWDDTPTNHNNPFEPRPPPPRWPMPPMYNQPPWAPPPWYQQPRPQWSPTDPRYPPMMMQPPYARPPWYPQQPPPQSQWPMYGQHPQWSPGTQYQWPPYGGGQQPPMPPYGGGAPRRFPYKKKKK